MTIHKPQTLSIIETISAGFGALNRRLWVLLIPLALDVYLWWSAPLSFAPFFALIRDQLAEAAATLTTNAQEQEQFVVRLMNTDMRNILAWFNFVPILAPQVFNDSSAAMMQPIAVSDPLVMLLLVVLINTLTLLISSVFLTVLATGVQPTRRTLTAYLWQWVQAIVGMSAYLILCFGAIVLVSVPLTLLFTVLALVVPALAPLGLIVGFVLLFWGYVYTGFAVEAVLLDGVNPLQAVINSIQVVRRSFIPTLGLLMLSIIILSGMTVLWRSLVVHVPGLLIAIVGHAYIATGLLAARLVFYRERFRLAKSDITISV